MALRTRCCIRRVLTGCSFITHGRSGGPCVDAPVERAALRRNSKNHRIAGACDVYGGSPQQSYPSRAGHPRWPVHRFDDVAQDSSCSLHPCPCGFYGDGKRPCSCAPERVQRYLARVSGPLLDRIDLHVEVPAVRYQELSDGRLGEPSQAIRERVSRARERQRERFGGRPGLHANAHMSARDLREFCPVGEGGDALLRTAISRLGFSARAYHRVLKIARTIADLDGGGEIGTAHVSEAIQYRSLDRLLAA